MRCSLLVGGACRSCMITYININLPLVTGGHEAWKSCVNMYIAQSPTRYGKFFGWQLAYPSLELTYPLPADTFESMIFLFPFSGIWIRSLEIIYKSIPGSHFYVAVFLPSVFFFHKRLLAERRHDPVSCHRGGFPSKGGVIYGWLMLSPWVFKLVGEAEGEIQWWFASDDLGLYWLDFIA